MYGYAGKILYVNLTEGSFKEEELSEEWKDRFIAGVGINNRLAYDIIKPQIAPLSPENPVIIGSGLFGGTMIPGGSKLMVTAKFPMTNSIGTAVGGGSFASIMKFAGYDHIIITGRAERLSVLKIDENPEVIDASELKGMDIFDTTEYLLKKYYNSSVIAIGISGENMVKPSLAFIDNIATIGRGGLGAILGSKNIKAVVVRGTNGIKVYDPDGVNRVVNLIYEKMSVDPLFSRWVKDGVRIGWPSWVKGEFSYKNDREVYTKERAIKLYESERFHEIVDYKPLCCLNCPIADKGRLKIKKGEFEGLTTYVSEFLQGMIAFGIKSNIGDDYNKILKCLDMGNRLGLDVFTISYMLGYIVELYEEGIITEGDYGKEPKLDFENITNLMDEIANRKGFGAIFSDGWIEGIKKIGKEAEKYALLIKGLEPCYMDPRINFGTEAFGQFINPRGAFVVQAESPTVLPLRTSDKVWRHCATIGVSEDIRDRIFDTPREFNVALFTKYCEDWYHLLNIFGLCARQQIVQRYDINLLSEIYKLITGKDIPSSDLRDIGERVLNIGKVLNVREGFSRKDDTFVERWFKPLKGEDKEIELTDYYKMEKIKKEDIEELLDQYYSERGWDIKKGIPTKRSLYDIGLKDIADEMEELL
jgi:aldehyde:ferredoxin oxidoreductase